MPTERPFIEHLELTGYKSIRKASIELTRLNVLIGSNGAGKSNLVSFFALLSAALRGKLDEYVGRHGGPDSLLHLGVKHTDEITVAITMRAGSEQIVFSQKYLFRAPDSLYATNYLPPGLLHENALVLIGATTAYTLSGHQQTIPDVNNQGERSRGFWAPESLRNRQALYHLDDTSLVSPIRREGFIRDNKRLHPDAGNLASILYLYKCMHLDTYKRICATVRKVAPSFDDFELEPQRLNPNNILLNWRQKGNDYLLDPHQISDGTLRAMALITLLLQPEEDLPDLLIIDEPELGLHPHALTIIAGLIRAVSVKTQVIVTTQSTAFLDQFSADEIIVVDSEQGTSQFRRLDPESLKDWLEEYSVGELWQKNVIGGGPVP